MNMEPNNVILHGFIMMAQKGKTCVCVSLDIKRLKQDVINICILLNIDVNITHDCVRMNSGGRILFRTVDTSREKYLGLRIDTMWINEW